jgi:hypothetical protein
MLSDPSAAPRLAGGLAGLADGPKFSSASRT